MYGLGACQLTMKRNLALLVLSAVIVVKAAKFGGIEIVSCKGLVGMDV